MKKTVLAFFFFALASFAVAQSITVDSIGTDSAGVIIRITTTDTLNDGRIVQVSKIGNKQTLKEKYRARIDVLNERIEEAKKELARLRKKKQDIRAQFQLANG